jgi:predicted transcriptional regulator
MSKSEPHTNKDDGTDQTNNFEFASDAVTDTDLTAFQQHILFALRGCEEGRYDGDAPGGAKGLAIKQILETDEWYGEEINHGRLYPNLDTLVDHGLVAKSELDKRTNHYELTDDGLEVIAEGLQRYISAFKGEPKGNGGE